MSTKFNFLALSLRYKGNSLDKKILGFVSRHKEKNKEAVGTAAVDATVKTQTKLITEVNLMGKAAPDGRSNWQSVYHSFILLLGIYCVSTVCQTPLSRTVLTIRQSFRKPQKLSYMHIVLLITSWIHNNWSLSMKKGYVCCKMSKNKVILLTPNISDDKHTSKLLWYRYVLKSNKLDIFVLRPKNKR